MRDISIILRTMEEYAQAFHVPILRQHGVELLKQTVINRRPRSILEIGTAIGYSTLHMAAVMPSEAHITSIELDQERVAVACQFITEAGFLPNVHLLCGDAAEILPELTGDYDLVFIDAAKGQYLNYLRMVLPKLAPGAAVIADNVLFRGFVQSDVQPPRRYRTLVRRLRDYLEFVQNQPYFHTTLYEVGDGLTISYYQGENADE